MSPQALARVVAAAREFTDAEIAYEKDHTSAAWLEKHIRVDNARRELRRSLGYEGER